MLCFNIIILALCLNSGVNLVLGDIFDVSSKERDTGNVLEFSIASKKYNNVPSRIAREIPAPLLSSTGDVAHAEGDDHIDEVEPSRKLFKEIKGIVTKVASGASTIAKVAEKVGKGAEVAKSVFNTIRGKSN